MLKETCLTLADLPCASVSSQKPQSVLYVLKTAPRQFAGRACIHVCALRSTDQPIWSTICGWTVAQNSFESFKEPPSAHSDSCVRLVAATHLISNVACKEIFVFWRGAGSEGNDISARTFAKARGEFVSLCSSFSNRVIRHIVFVLVFISGGQRATNSSQPVA